MNLKEANFDEQVSYLRSLLRSGKSSFASYLALFALRHHLATKHSPEYSVRPVLRWYLGQLAKEYIARYFNEAKANLENFAEIGLLEVKPGKEGEEKEFRLNEEIYPALLDVLEEIFGKECIDNAISRAKYYRNPGSAKNRPQKSDEVRG